MRNLRNRFERFCYQNRDKGIPNLMLYITLGSAVVYLLSMFDNSYALYYALCFDRAKILQGQVWRLFTYVFTEAGGSLLSLLFLYFFYMLGRYVETSMGTFRFNLFYFSGVILMDVFAMIFCPAEPLLSTIYAYNLYIQMGFYLHLSLLLTFAVTNPDAQFYIFMLIPIRAWIMSIIYVAWIVTSVFQYYHAGFDFPNYLFPLVGIANFVLFAGKDIANVLPPAWRPRGRNQYRTVRQRRPEKHTGTIPFPNREQPAPKAEAYTHKCSVCGRTDVSNPELEFRYCSRCNGYHCYCQDHINNHTHIQ